MFYCVGLKSKTTLVYDSEDGTLGSVDKKIVRDMSPSVINKGVHYIPDNLEYEDKHFCVKTKKFVSEIERHKLYYAKNDLMYTFELVNNIDGSYFVYICNVLYKVIDIEVYVYFLPCVDSVQIIDYLGVVLEIKISDIRNFAKQYSTAKYRRGLLLRNVSVL